VGENTQIRSVTLAEILIFTYNKVNEDGQRSESRSFILYKR